MVVIVNIHLMDGFEYLVCNSLEIPSGHCLIRAEYYMTGAKDSSYDEG